MLRLHFIGAEHIINIEGSF